MTNDKLKQAIVDGEAIFKDAEALAAQLKREELVKKQEEYRKSVIKIKASLEKDDYLYKFVAEAVSKNKKEFVLRGVRAMADAINEIEGFHASFAEGDDYINSDEIKEHWSRITVTWDKK